jgi:hypothetical protein
MEQMMEHPLTEIEANNKTFDVLQGILFSQMDIHQEGMEAKMDANLKEYVAEMRAWLKEMLC